MGQADSSKEGKRRAALWRKYAAQLHVAEMGVQGLRAVLLGVLTLIGVLGLTSIVGNTPLKVAGGIIGAICLFLIGLLQFSGTFAKGLSEMFVATTESDTKTLTEVKRELEAALREMSSPIVVILDDLDRLAPDEVRLMLQLVKANADMPQLVYVMLFERALVEHALDEYTSGRGRDFLDKIVQVSFDLPLLEQSRLNKVLFEKLDELLSRGDAGKRFDASRWGNLYIGALQQFFLTLRDVNRFIGTLSFYLALLTTEGTLEVNPLDLIALESLRHFEPDTYAMLPRFKELLTSVSSFGAGAQYFDQQRRTMATDLLDSARTKDATREVLKQLFPPVETYFGGQSNYGANFAEEWRRDLRVCSDGVFDRYFYLALPEMDIPQGVLDRVIGLSGQRDALVAELCTIQSRGLFDVLLDRLEPYKQEIAIQDAIPFVTALFDVGDDISEVSSGMFELSPMMHAVRIVLWYLRQEPRQEERQRVLLASLSQTSGINFPVRFIVFITPSRDAGQRSHEEPLLSEELLAPLQKKCVDLLNAAAADGRLARQENLPALLAAWRDWGDAEDVQAWVESLIAREDELIALIRRFVQPVRSSAMGSHVARTSWRLILGNLEPYLTVEALRARLAAVDDGVLNSIDKRAIEAARTAIGRRDKGIADTAFGWDD